MNRFIRYTQPASASLYPLFANRRAWTGYNTADRFLESALTELAKGLSPRFPVDLYEDKDNNYVRATLPGVGRDDIGVELVDGQLTINATRKNGEESSKLTRSVVIPEAVQADKVSATYENGILTVTLPKQEQAKPRKIDVSVN